LWLFAGTLKSRRLLAGERRATQKEQKLQNKQGNWTKISKKFMFVDKWNLSSLDFRLYIVFFH